MASIAWVVLFAAVSYGLLFGIGKLLVQTLGRAWRAAGNAHWTQRARLAYGPGLATMIFPALLIPSLAFIGCLGPELVEPRSDVRMQSFWTCFVAGAFAGMTVRYRWLRGLWGPLVTVRSWLAGCLILLTHVPQILIMAVLVLVMPDTPDQQAALIFTVGVLAVAFFAWDGEVCLLRWLRLASTAPPELVRMVEQVAREMKIPGDVRVLVLDWPMVNAVAWLEYHGIGFSHALLKVMTDKEVRAVAAHELAHLGESRWVRAMRKLYKFAYLVVVPLFKYCGSAGPIGGVLLVFSIFIANKRFSLPLEQRADRIEREATDANDYARSLLTLHQSNLAPAVMPGKQTHPHLYDRLLAGGIQPDFPRPDPPSRGKPLLAVVGAIILGVVLMCVIVVAAGVVMQFVRRLG